MTTEDRDTLYQLVRTHGAATIADLAIRACYGRDVCHGVQDEWETFLDRTGWCDEVRGENEQLAIPSLHIVP